MLLNEREERNVVISLVKDIEQPSYPKDKLTSEISTILNNNYLSEKTSAMLLTLLQRINQMPADNENSICKLVAN
jgi:hypothetical protein